VQRHYFPRKGLRRNPPKAPRERQPSVLERVRTEDVWLLAISAVAYRLTDRELDGGALVEHLGRTGYVEKTGRSRRPSGLATAPDRARSSVRRGVRAFARRVEADGGKRVGARRVRELCETLAQIVAEDAGD
jgi:hypothetical protein